jgi:hypothetical protein
MTVPIFTDEIESYVRPDGITVIKRRAFCSQYWDYKPGEHVVFGGPSKRGKTELAFDLMEFTAFPELPAYVAVSKPKDPVTARRGMELGYRRVKEWPPSRTFKELLGEKPSGYLIWPSFGDIDTDFDRCATVTARLLGDRYTAGVKNQHGILVMDDTMVKAKIMKLDRQMVTILAMAGAMGIGLWVFIQKPTDSGSTTLWAFENADHEFFTKGGDARMLQRYVEIAGENGPIVKAVVPTLDEFQFLYMHKTQGFICIVDAK